jgi:hypothetical protein
LVTLVQSVASSNAAEEPAPSVGAYSRTPSSQERSRHEEANLPTTPSHVCAPLRNADVLRIWEDGHRQTTIDRALTILETAYPSEAREALTTLPIGVRDSRLLAVREATFGAALNCLSTCPVCSETTELMLDTVELQSAITPPLEVSDRHLVAVDGWEIEFRLPNSCDLKEVIEAGDPTDPQQQLIERCIFHVVKDGKSAAPTAKIVDHVYAEMARLDPGAELDLVLTCPNCESEWHAPFDIARFLWIEIEATAKRLLREVATLARAYGWREADILAQSADRRQTYLDLM